MLALKEFLLETESPANYGDPRIDLIKRGAGR